MSLYPNLLHYTVHVSTQELLTILFGIAILNGAPRYALVDLEGKVTCYVSPAPGVNLHYYVGREVGVTGIRGYQADQDTPHVTAKHVATVGRLR